MPETSPRPRLLVVRNPVAGRARSGRARAWFEALGAVADVTMRDTANRGEAEAWAREARDFDRIVIAGGDGTIGEAIAGLLARQDAVPPLGIVPLGTANVLAAELGLPDDPMRLAALLGRGAVRRLHPGLANGRPFAAMAGVGFDAEVVQRVSMPLKRKIGKGAYVVETLRQIGAYGFPEFDITVDGRRFSAASAIVAKGHFYGGRFVVCPDASPFRPRFQVALFGRRGPIAALGYAAALGVGMLPRLVTLIDAERIEIAGPAASPVQGDGDVLTRLPAKIEIAPRTVAVIVGDLGQAATGPI